MGIFDLFRSRTGASQPGGESRKETRSACEQALVKELQGILADDAGRVLRYRLRFTGRVQGVGFRWTNQGKANELGATGWVKNLDDGSVALEFQGTASQLIKHLDAVHAYYDQMQCPMLLVEAHRIAVREDDSGFSVRY